MTEPDGQGLLFEPPLPAPVAGEREAVEAGRVFVGRCQTCTSTRPGRAVVGVRTAAPVWRGTVAFVECPGCGRAVQVQRVEAVPSPGRVCDVACMTATGSVCRCGCGGAAHGRMWGNLDRK